MTRSMRSHFPERLDLTAFFVGQSQAWGMVMNRSGKVERRFRVEITGQLEGDALVLEEHFAFDDGESDERVWKIARKGEAVSGRANDVFGEAGGAIHGPSLNWSYNVGIRFRGHTVRVHFDDWMTLADEDVMLSRAAIRKFGIRVADVFIAFRKSQDVGLKDAA